MHFIGVMPNLMVSALDHPLLFLGVLQNRCCVVEPQVSGPSFDLGFSKVLFFPRTPHHRSGRVSAQRGTHLSSQRFVRRYVKACRMYRKFRLQVCSISLITSTRTIYDKLV